MNRYSIPLVGLSFLVGCTTAPTPPLRADNPANPSAREGTIRPLRNALGIDDLTKKSRQILAQAAKQQRQWDQNGPVSGGAARPANAEHVRHANAPAAGAIADSAKAPNGSNAWHEDAPGTIPTMSKLCKMFASFCASH
jgi:hypothetical protein